MHPTRPTLLACLGLALVLLTSGCRSYPPGVPLPDIVDEVNATLQPAVVRLQPGDAVKVRFLNNQGNNQTVQVRPDGRANFYLLDEMEVQGMTIDQLQDELTRAYEESLISPELTVSVGKMAPRFILVLGREGRRVPLQPRLRMGLIEFLSQARIPKKTTTPMQHFVLMRKMPDEGRTRVWTIDARQEFWYHPVPLWLQADDIVFIPQQPILDAAEWMRAFFRLLPLPQFLLRQS